MKISGQNLANIKASLIIESEILSSVEISELTGMEVSIEKNENNKTYRKFDEGTVLRSFPVSEDEEIDFFISSNLNQKQEVWDILKDKAKITLLLKAQDEYEHRQLDEDIKYNSDIEISVETMEELLKRNINLKINQSFLIRFYDYNF